MRTTKIVGQPRGRGHLRFPSGATTPVSYKITIRQDFIDGTPGLFKIEGDLAFQESPPLPDLLMALRDDDTVTLEDPGREQDIEISIRGELSLPEPRRCSFGVPNPGDLITPYESS